MTRVAVVTGAASGIGLVAAQRWAAKGGVVAAIDRNADGLEAVRANNPGIRVYACDIGNEDAVVATTRSIVDELGPVQRLFHAAGICRIGSALAQPSAEIAALLDVNFFGTVNVCRAIVPAMVSRGAGSVVLVSSLAGWMPSPGFSAYAASKAAATAYAEALSNELHGTGVQLTCVCPTEVDTPLAKEIRSIDASAFGGMRPMSVEKFMDQVEEKVDRREPPLFVFPGVSGALWRARRWAPDFMRRQTLRQTSSG